ncbi:MAG: hypothetical protein ACKV2U_25570 [Bryobacteraceae bacterium]
MTSRVIHVSIATGMMFVIYAIPVLSFAFVAWTVATIPLACGGRTLVRTGGFTGDLDQDFAWRRAATGPAFAALAAGLIGGE